MSMKQLKILGAAVRRPAPVAQARTAQAQTGEAETARSVPEQRHLFVEVENPNDKPIHVWAGPSTYDYDSSSHVLTMHLAEHTPSLPPGITMISNHPRTPAQVTVNAKSRVKIKVPVPAVVRRRVPGKGLGMSFVEEPIGEIERVDLHVQYADEPLQQPAKESPDEHRKRLQAHGQVVRATIKPTPSTEKEQ